MTNLPGKDGKNCVFRVVRVSGTIRKAQEEAIRRARELILAAQRDHNGRGDTTLEGIFGKTEETTSTNDVQMVDRSDSEEEAESDDE
jgi:ribonuclease P/MRP protein subunit POP5